MRQSVFPSRSKSLDMREIFMLMTNDIEPVLALFESVMRRDSPFTAGERELMYAFISRLNGCEFAAASHTVCARELGAPVSALDDLVNDISTAALSEKLKPVFYFAKKLTLSPGKVEENDARPIYAAGWDERAVIDTVSVCSLVAFVNRLLDGFGAWLPEEKHIENGTRLAESGYLSIGPQIQAAMADQLFHQVISAKNA